MGRKRILLYCHDGVGLGHLRRISRIAAKLQQRYSCLVATGVREALWLVPDECEILKLPSWEGIDRSRARRRGRVPAIEMDRQEAVAFRSALLMATARSFNPNAIVVDYRPFGNFGELREMLSGTAAKKYLIHRGISDTSDGSELAGSATEEIADTYDRIMVVADPRLSDLAMTDRYCPRAAAKIEYCGYIVPETTRISIDSARNVVCSGGGGFGSEELMTACLRAADHNPYIPMCIVLGPRSRMAAQDLGGIPSHVKFLKSTMDLGELHASAAVVVSSGGYNSVLEAISGGARIIIHPNQRGSDDEQERFAQALSTYYPIRIVRELGALSGAIQEEYELFSKCGKASFQLAIQGLSRILAIISKDIENHQDSSCVG